MSIYVIAEAGVNHNGSIELAKKLVDMAVDCGADAVKFQTFKAYESTGVFADKAEYQKRNMPGQESQYEMIEKLELSFDSFSELKAYCTGKNITFISTPDGVESLDFLISLDVPQLKVGSAEVTNLEFLKAIALKGKPIILSTGMSTLGEIELALGTIFDAGNHDLQLMHCTTDYPTELEDVNLKAMVTMREAFKVPVGFSDHTRGNEAAVAAVALGAVVIEKHITLDKEMAGPDHKASMSPDEFLNYVRAIRSTEKLLGDGIKRPTRHELAIMQDVRRSIVAAADLKAGTVVTRDMLCSKRPGSGLAPSLMYIFEGRTLKRDLRKDEPIRLEDI